MSDSTPTTRRFPRRARWAVPGVAALAVAAAFAIPGMAGAASPNLPDRTAAELLADLAQAQPVAMSGTAVHTARLGLPELPTMAQEGSAATPTDLLTGSTTVKVWTDGKSAARASLLGSASEYSMVVNGTDAWTYSSGQNAAVHYTLPAGTKAAGATGDPTTTLTPQQAADQALKAIDPSTTVAVDKTAKVAGRDCYQLILTPKGSGTLVGSVRIALDADTSLPLRVQVWSAEDPDTPALEVAFTDVSFTAPAASVFDFVPPAGTDVKNVTVPEFGDKDLENAHESMPVKVTGEGWTSVVEITDVQALGDTAGSGAGMFGSSDATAAAGGEATSGSSDSDVTARTRQLASLMDSATTTVPEGRILSTNLVTVLFTDDGRVLAGAVPASTLQAAAR